MFCTKCGAEIPEGAKFCIKCGAPVTLPDPAQPKPAAQPAQPVSPWARPQPKAEPAQAAPPVEPMPSVQADPAAETTPAKQSLRQKNGRSSKKGIWVGIAIALVIIIAAVVVFAVVHNKQKNSTADTSTTAAVSQATTKDAAASKTSYLTDSSLISENYVEKYREDLINMIDHTNVDIVETGFSKANDFQKVKPGHTYNSLIFVVEDGGRYGIYEYADIKVDGNGNLLPPSKFNGRVRNYDSWDKVETYLANKPGDTYTYNSIES